MIKNSSPVIFLLENVFSDWLDTYLGCCFGLLLLYRRDQSMPVTGHVILTSQTGKQSVRRLWYHWVTIYTWRGLLLITANRVWYNWCLINAWYQDKCLSSLYWCHSVWGGWYMRVYGNILEFCQNELQIRFSIQPGMNLACASINNSHSVHAIGVQRSPVQSRLYSNDIFWHYMAVTYSHLHKYHLPGTGSVISYVHG